MAVYARYSSHLQREASIEDQVRRCTGFVTSHGGAVEPALVFTDFATSGASLARPGFERLLQQLDEKPPRIDAIVTEDISRISRDFADAASIFQRLRYLGIPLLGVADGIDTSAKHAKVTFTIKSLVSDLYLDDLRDKTLRGLEGRALAGYSTGGLPYGYKSSPVKDAYDRIIGHKIEIDEEQAKVVRRVFALYLEGRSLDAIAHLFNKENVPPPRAKTRHRRKGWVASTIRAFLHNESYIGKWSYKSRQWQKVPGTNARRPRRRDASEVIRTEHPDRRIIDAETWAAVQARLCEVRAFYTKESSGAPKGRGIPGRRTVYPLSGILRCGECGAPMIIIGGSSATYYRCGDSKKRGTCANKLSVREDIARARILGALRDRLSSPAAVMYLRKRIAERLGDVSRMANAELEERRERLARTEERLAGLIRFIAEGDHSEYIRLTLRDLEAQTQAEKAAIKALVDQAAAPLRLPTPDEVMAGALNLEKVVASDPTRGREELRKLFEGGRLVLKPQPGAFYIAESKLLPLMVLSSGSAPETTKPQSLDRGFQVSRGSAISCAGRI